MGHRSHAIKFAFRQQPIKAGGGKKINELNFSILENYQKNILRMRHKNSSFKEILWKLSFA